MVDRYVQKVPPDLLNVVGGSEAAQLAARTTGGDLIPMPDYTDWMEQGKPIEVSSLSPMAFGESLDRDRTWAAKCNQMRAIQRLADDEFCRTKADILEWYAKAIRRNHGALLDAAARGELTLPGFGRHDQPEPVDDPRALRQHVGTGFCYKDYFFFPGAHGSLTGGMRRGEYLCYEGMGVASVFTQINVECAEAIAIVTATPVDKLPEVLRQYRFGVQWFGANFLLMRLDPEDWILRSPWNKLHFDIGIASSRTAMNLRRKRMGLGRRNWNDLVPKRDED